MIIKDKVYGEQEVEDSLIINLINSPKLQRLKGVGQYGTWKIINEKLNTTRFEHSFGVYCLLKRFGANFEEQIAGLIHDVNHTAFSHVVDYVLGDPSTQEFGDSKHSDIIRNSTIPLLLKGRNININKICNPHNFGLLERELPDICCDRLDYCLRDSICCDFLDQKGATKILNSVIVHDGELICKDKESALSLGKLFLKMSNFLWSNEVQAGSYLFLAEALKVAVKNNIISEDDFYMTDRELLDILANSKNKKILEFLSYMDESIIIPGTKEDHDIYSKSKCCYIDPKFLNNGKVIRLSEADKDFKKEIEDFKKKINRGFYIKIKK